MLHGVWPDARATAGHHTSLPAKAPRPRSTTSTPLPGEGSETAAGERRSRSPRWVWATLAPASPLLLALHRGDRTLARAPRVVHPGVQGLTPGCVPLFLTEGCKESTTARLPQGGRWGHPPRRPATGPAPQPRWLPRPGRL